MTGVLEFQMRGNTFDTETFWDSFENNNSTAMYGSDDMWDFNAPSDITLVVEGKEFHVHKSVLSESSPVFRVMFESNFREKVMDKITLPGKRAKPIEQMLNFIYPFGHQITEKTDVYALLDLAQEYQFLKLRDQCELFLLKKVATIELLLLAQMYDLNRLRESCISQLSVWALSSLQEHPRYREIEDRNKLLILENQMLKVNQYCKRVSQIIMASDQRYLPIIVPINCNHRPKNNRNPHFICTGCKAATLKNFVREESAKMGLEHKSK